ncbi:MAG: lipopolysaccharide heptosyltransferase II [Simkaniaceae bacterium]|nr:lipopolysaccharide heptosyltransferase II [Simkaniaceae bacterium]
MATILLAEEEDPWYTGGVKEQSYGRIIVRMPNWVGDIVMATPVLALLKKAYPEASLTAMMRRGTSALLQHDPALDDLLPFTKGADERDRIERLRRNNYDLGILLTGSFSSAWLFWQGRVRNTYGFRKDGRRLLMHRSVPLPKQTQHLVLTYQSLLHPLGIRESKSLPPHLYVTYEEKVKARQYLEEASTSIRSLPFASLKWIGISPSAAYGPAKCWLPERFREVIDKVLDTDPSHVVLVFGDTAHERQADYLCAPFAERVINLAGRTDLRRFMALISLCSVVLTNDSGPMHIADALHVPLVALFGSTDPSVTGPYGQPDAVLRKPVFCSPCFKRICPIDFRCMKGITVEEVTKRILSILRRTDRTDGT